MRPVLAKTLVVLGVALLLGLIGYAQIKNRDRNHVFLERLNPHTYVTTDLPQLLYLDAMANPEDTVTIDPEKISTKDECLNGKKAKDLTTKEQLMEFIKGPCLPVVAVPGLLATKLAVKIDCETFSEHNPEIFKACGWSTCSSWKFWKGAPKEDYSLWISDFFGPVSILFQSSVKCWGNIIQLDVDSTETDITKKYKSPKGVTISIYGTGENEQSKSKCGFGAISNILPIPYQTGYSKGFDGIYNSFKNMGYQPGLTLFATPYDWRKTTMANGITEVLRETVHQIYEMTGKPSIVMAHSMGNFGTLHMLNSLTKEEKEKYIANYVSITNPLAGSPKAIKTFLGGDKDYIYKKFGINFYAQRMLIKGSSGAVDLLPKNTYSHFADEDWLQEWKVRSDFENHNDVRTPEGRKAWEEAVEKGGFGYSWFPHPLNNCSRGFEQRRDECGLYMYNWSKIALATIQDQSWTASQTDLKHLFNEFVLTTNYSDTMFEDIQSHNIFQLKNPEVPITLIYGSHLWTDMTYKWDYDPRENTRKDEFAFSTEILYSQGDQTVPTSSALLPALKWSWEFDNKEKAQAENPKPVKTVEICSIYNNKEDVYDKKDGDGAHQVLHNEYIGLKCDCFNDKNDHPVLGQSCDHADILNDSKFLTFLTKIANANHRIEDVSNLLVNDLSDQDLAEIANTCPSVGRNVRLLDMFKQEIQRVKDIPTKTQIQD